jgi:hypothetical protein
MLFAPRRRTKMSAIVLTLAAVPAFAESPAPEPRNSGDTATTSITLPAIEVISEQLEAARLQIQPSLGASTYYFGSEALQTIPQGENVPLNQVLLQMPAVAQDSFGQIHVRGEHANVQFRINGVQLPEGLSVFGQALETRFARSVSLKHGPRADLATCLRRSGGGRGEVALLGEGRPRPCRPDQRSVGAPEHGGMVGLALP